ncbi:MAG: hypothetical protein ABIS50_10815 [Luteolibacter sp.]|uniref:hypothetical protein n=1 Tax=Luteolibacter sp. TaxID=1962973 RepID=UPI003267993B
MARFPPCKPPFRQSSRNPRNPGRILRLGFQPSGGCVWIAHLAVPAGSSQACESKN